MDRISRSGQRQDGRDPPAEVRGAGAAGLADTRGAESRLLARSALVEPGPSLVSPRHPGYVDLPRTLQMVHGAGAALFVAVRHAGPVLGQRLSRALRFHPQPEITQ